MLYSALLHTLHTDRPFLSSLQSNVRNASIYIISYPILSPIMITLTSCWKLQVASVVHHPPSLTEAF